MSLNRLIKNFEISEYKLLCKMVRRFSNINLINTAIFIFKKIIDHYPQHKEEIEQDINIQNILPGTYKLKVVFDENNNGIWDNGDFNTNTQPEKVKYLTEQLILKAYWDLEQSVLIE